MILYNTNPYTIYPDIDDIIDKHSISSIDISKIKNQRIKEKVISKASMIKDKDLIVYDRIPDDIKQHLSIDTESLKNIRLYGKNHLLTSLLNNEFADKLEVDYDYSGYKGACVMEVLGVIKAQGKTRIKSMLFNKKYSEDRCARCIPYDLYFFVDIDTKKVVGHEEIPDEDLLC